MYSIAKISPRSPERIALLSGSFWTHKFCYCRFSKAFENVRNMFLGGVVCRDDRGNFILGIN